MMRVDGSTISGTSIVSTNVLARPKSIGIWRVRARGERRVHLAVEARGRERELALAAAGDDLLDHHLTGRQERARLRELLEQRLAVVDLPRLHVRERVVDHARRRLQDHRVLELELGDLVDRHRDTTCAARRCRGSSPRLVREPLVLRDLELLERRRREPEGTRRATRGAGRRDRPTRRSSGTAPSPSRSCSAPRSSRYVACSSAVPPGHGNVRFA